MIAVVTGVPRFYYEAAAELKERGVEFLSLSIGQEIPSRVRVVLTSEGEKSGIKFPNVIADKSVKKAVDQCIQALRGFKGKYRRLVVGIDPGRKPGIAVLGDRRVLAVQSVASPEGIAGALKDIFASYPSDEWIVRVGIGGGIYGMRVLKLLQENFRVLIETVDETSTTPQGKGSGKHFRDVIAAVNIALRKGKVLKSVAEVMPKAGEIKNIQRESRALSGDITISKELAESVAIGLLTLEDSIAVQRKKIR